MDEFFRLQGGLFPAKKRVKVARGDGNHRASIDAARTTEDNRYRWSGADGLGPNAEFNEGVRDTLRRRSRFEARNNSYCKSLVRAKGRDLIGTGPRLQLTIPGVDFTATKQIEQRYGDWCEAVVMPRKLRVMEYSAVRCGEIFGVFATDDSLPDPVKLEIPLMEAEHCQTPWNMAVDASVRDGIRVDDNGKPVEYFFLREHPGEAIFGGLSAQAGTFFSEPARNVLHWFRQDRAGQLRGIPETTPALPVFNQTRTYGRAVLDCAETAASTAGVLYTDLRPDETMTTDVERFEIVDVVRNAFKTMPHGWKLEQLEATQPTSSYESFTREKLNEAGRSCDAPLNIVTGNSSGYNFASGRLDHLPYQRGEWVDRDDFETLILDRIFRAWLAEALLIAGHLPADLPDVSLWTWAWNWDGFDEINPVDSANADDIRLKGGTTSMSVVMAAQGIDWRSHAEQLAEEIKYYRELEVRHPLDIGGSVETVAVDEEGNKTGDSIVADFPAGESGKAKSTSVKAAATAGDVQGTALNGAQTQSLVTICDRLVERKYDAIGAQAMIEASYPLMDKALISRMVNALAAHTPPAESPSEPTKKDAKPEALNGHSRLIGGVA